MPQLPSFDYLPNWSVYRLIQSNLFPAPYKGIPSHNPQVPYLLHKGPKEYAEGFVKVLSPICPHLGEELWGMLGHVNTIAYETWPTYDESKLDEDTLTLGVQVNGKLRGTAVVSVDASEDEIKEIAFQDENVKRHTEGKEIVKVIVIKGKIVNIVVKG